MTPHEEFCFNTAIYFTAVRGRTPSQRIKKQFKSLEDAKAFAAEFGDCRTMIYAVNELGNNAHICNA